MEQMNSKFHQILMQIQTSTPKKTFTRKRKRKIKPQIYFYKNLRKPSIYMISVRSIKKMGRTFFDITFIKKKICIYQFALYNEAKKFKNVKNNL